MKAQEPKFKAMSKKQADQAVSVFKKLHAAMKDCQKAGFLCAVRGIEVALDLVQSDLVMAYLYEPVPSEKVYTWKAVPPKKVKKEEA